MLTFSQKYSSFRVELTLFFLVTYGCYSDVSATLMDRFQNSVGSIFSKFSSMFVCILFPLSSFKIVLLSCRDVSLSSIFLPGLPLLSCTTRIFQ